MLPLTAVVLVGATVSGFLAARFGPRLPMTAGFAAGAAGALVVVAGGALGSPGVVIGGLALMGFCSLAMPAMTSVALTAAPVPVRGLASGVLNTSRQMGGAIGVAALGAVLAVSGVDAHGLATAVGLAVAGYVVTLVCAVRSTR